MAINFEKLDDKTVTVSVPGAFILLDKNGRGWGAKGYFNGGADLTVGHKYTDPESAYYALKDKLAIAVSKLMLVEL